MLKKLDVNRVLYIDPTKISAVYESKYMDKPVINLLIDGVQFDFWQDEYQVVVDFVNEYYKTIR